MTDTLSLAYHTDHLLYSIVRPISVTYPIVVMFSHDKRANRIICLALFFVSGFPCIYLKLLLYILYFYFVRVKLFAVTGSLLLQYQTFR